MGRLSKDRGWPRVFNPGLSHVPHIVVAAGLEAADKKGPDPVARSGLGLGRRRIAAPEGQPGPFQHAQHVVDRMASRVITTVAGSRTLEHLRFVLCNHTRPRIRDAKKKKKKIQGKALEKSAVNSEP